jgi:hypothetical protein
MRFPVRTLLLASVITAAGGCGTQTPEAPAAAAPASEALASTRQLMLGITIPTSDVVFQVGVKPPADDLEWEKVEANAMALAESGHLLMVGSRVVDQEEWMQHARQLVATAREAAEAARQKNVDAVLAAGDRIYEVCDGCHSKYMAARAGE